MKINGDEVSLYFIKSHIKTEPTGYYIYNFLKASLTKLQIDSSKLKEQ